MFRRFVLTSFAVVVATSCSGGDEIIFETDAGTFTYLVTDAQVIEPTDLWIISQTPAFTATLFACHPPGSTAQRYAVFAELAQ